MSKSVSEVALQEVKKAQAKKRASSAQEKGKLRLAERKSLRGVRLLRRLSSTGGVQEPAPIAGAPAAAPAAAPIAGAPAAAPPDAAPDADVDVPAADPPDVRRKRLQRGGRNEPEWNS